MDLHIGGGGIQSPMVQDRDNCDRGLANLPRAHAEFTLATNRRDQAFDDLEAKRQGFVHALPGDHARSLRLTPSALFDEARAERHR